MKAATVLLLVAYSIAAVSGGCPTKKKTTVVTTKRPSVCTPGSTTKIDCNVCICLDDGQWACTKIGCPKTTQVLTTEKPKLCTPGTTKKLDCNDCFCTEDGEWVCTEKFCPPTTTSTTETPEICTPGETKKVDCNTCSCGEGGQWLCTLRACLVTTEVPTTEEPKLCTPGTTKKIDCNDCFCTEGGVWACTKMFCPETTPEAPEVCTPGDIMQIDCNTCTCTEGGMWICTLMVCPTPTEVTTTEKPMLCTPGTTKKLDCNNCFCTESGLWACTKIFCNITTPAPPTKKPLLCGANEVREECYNPCPSDKCADIGRQETCAVIEKKDCKPGCRCALHFRRNKAGVCIDTRKCPAHKCKSGEFWDHDCSVNVTCNDERCIREPIYLCKMMVPAECIPRCQCKKNHCRNENGKCIKKGCKGDPNAVCLKCGDPCPITCRNKDVFPRETCERPCKKNGCKCVTGYVLDDEGVCIPELECPEICVNPNEEFQKCRADQYCTGILAGEEVILPKPDVCKPNCRCNEGYVRDYNNICILPEECYNKPDTEQP